MPRCCSASSALAPRALLCCSANCCPQLLRPRRRSGVGAPASPPAAPPSASYTHLRPWASRPRRRAAALTRARPVPGRQDDCTACSPGPHPPARRRPARPRPAPPSRWPWPDSAAPGGPRTRGSACALAPILRAGFRHPAGRFRLRRLPPSGLPASHATPPTPRRSSRLRLTPRRLPPRRASRPVLTTDSGSGYAGCRRTGPTPPVAACSPLLPATRYPASAFAAPRLRDPAPASVRPWPPAPRASSIAAPRPPASPADWCHARLGWLPRWPTPRPPGRPGCLPTTCSRAAFRRSATAAGCSCWKGPAAQEKKET
nr:vegetative cell wall protein gp1-like [Aegilops tauschii subsp. strangulata]